MSRYIYIMSFSEDLEHLEGNRDNQIVRSLYLQNTCGCVIFFFFSFLFFFLFIIIWYIPFLLACQEKLDEMSVFLLFGLFYYPPKRCLAGWVSRKIMK